MSFWDCHPLWQNKSFRGSREDVAAAELPATPSPLPPAGGLIRWEREVPPSLPEPPGTCFACPAVSYLFLKSQSSASRKGWCQPRSPPLRPHGGRLRTWSWAWCCPLSPVGQEIKVGQLSLLPGWSLQLRSFKFRRDTVVIFRPVQRKAEEAGLFLKLQFSASFRETQCHIGIK